MSLLTLTPPAIVLLSSPLYLSLAKRAVEAYRLSWMDESIRTWWYEWPYSWVAAGGPVGRYVAGTVLGWQSLDRTDGGGVLRVEMGALVGIGLVLAMVTAVRLSLSLIGAILTTGSWYCNRWHDQRRTPYSRQRTRTIFGPSERSCRGAT